MKKFLVIGSVIGLLLCSTFGIVAVKSNTKIIDENYQKSNALSTTFTHTVFAEDGTATWCGYCHYAREALDKIYTSGKYPFFYVCMVSDKNTHASKRCSEFNIAGFPTVWFDYGYNVQVGGYTGNEADYKQAIIQCGERAVADINITLNVTWRGNAVMDISVAVKNNNETVGYAGHIHVYVTEVESSFGWKDTKGHPYTFPFLEYAFNEPITIASGGTWEKSITWDGHNYNNGKGQNFGSIQEGNIAVIAAVFNNTKNQGYSDPPYNSPFNAYYVDDAAGFLVPVSNNHPPNLPTLTGPKRGKTGDALQYNVTTTDPDDDPLYYFFDWGDTTTSGWIGPYSSGTLAFQTHIWESKGGYTIKVKAKDIHELESEWSSLTIKMPLLQNMFSYEPSFLGFLRQFLKNKIPMDRSESHLFDL